MSVVRIRRQPLNGKNRDTIEHKRANLTLNEGNFDLSGPRFGFIARGVVLHVNTSYQGAAADLHIDVMVQEGWGKREKFHRERWFVTFLDPGKEHMS